MSARASIKLLQLSGSQNPDKLIDLITVSVLFFDYAVMSLTSVSRAKRKKRAIL